MALGIVTRQTIHEGTAQLVIYRKKSAYQVALLHPSQRLEPLTGALFWTYIAALERLQAEVRARQ